MNSLIKSKPRKHGARSQIAFKTLRREIVTVTLMPGTPLDENTLAARFNMSRSPIREALARLSVEGLVIMLPNRATQVAPIDLQSFPKYIEALDFLQRATTRLAAKLRTDDDIVYIQEIATRFEEAVKLHNKFDMLSINQEFHLAIANAGKNPLLAKFYGTLLMEGLRLNHFTYDHLEKTYKERLLLTEHREIFHAIIDKDVDKADQFAHTHALMFKDTIINWLQVGNLDEFIFSSDESSSTIQTTLSKLDTSN
jgi:DNA-binding GntR family transcriptional regulator